MLKVYKGFDRWMHARPERRFSPEWDFGILWVLRGYRFPRWRVSWIEDTGELYAKELSEHGHFVVLGQFSTKDALDAHMAGWADNLAPKDLESIAANTTEHAWRG